MKFPNLRPRRILILIGVALVLVGQSASSVFLRYLRCQYRVTELTSTEGTYRGKAESLEELATNLRQIAVLAREMAGSSSSEFERSKWLEMARTEDRKADKSDEEAVRLMTRADYFSTQANEYSRLAWRPWLASPE